MKLIKSVLRTTANICNIWLFCILLVVHRTLYVYNLCTIVKHVLYILGWVICELLGGEIRLILGEFFRYNFTVTSFLLECLIWFFRTSVECSPFILNSCFVYTKLEANLWYILFLCHRLGMRVWWYCMTKKSYPSSNSLCRYTYKYTKPRTYSTKLLHVQEVLVHFI